MGRFLIWFLSLVAAIVFGVIVGARNASRIGFDGSSKSKFDEVMSLVRKNYVDDIDTKKLNETAVEAMLSDLDPHSVYMTADQLKKTKEEFQGNFEGVGIEFDILSDTLIVITPIAGGPSEKLGVLSGDKIIEIDDSSSVRLTRNDVFRKLRGAKGTNVRLKILRSGETQALVFKVERDKIPIYSINSSWMIDNETGYIRIDRFVENTHSEFMQAVKELKSQGMTRLVLDLRSNPGGYLDQAIKISDEFLGGAKKIVFTRGSHSKDEDAFSKPGDILEEMPVTIVLNRGSASASEIVAGALQDHDRALIIGETSFGKGLVQRQYELQDESAVRITISKYYTPSGRLIQRPYRVGKGEKENYYNDVQERYDSSSQSVENVVRKKWLESGMKPVEAALYIKPDSIHQAFKTDNGRTVLGGGGITPDYFMWSDTVSVPYRKLLASRTFETFTQQLLEEDASLRKRYEKEFGAFRKNYMVSDALLQRFLAQAAKEKIAFSPDELRHDEGYLKNNLKATLARQIWGYKYQTAIMLDSDEIIREAVKLFGNTNALAKAAETK
jgi:carboxyl-terminal processing protease